MKGIKWHRCHVMVVFFALLSLVIVTRVFYLMVFKDGFLQHQSAVRSVRLQTIPAHRGLIVDRHGDPLAISTTIYSVWVNPHLFTDLSCIPHLAKILHLSLAEIKKKVQAPSRFVYLKRGISPKIAYFLEKKNFPGVFFQKEYKRFYPESHMMASVLGFTNIDHRGQSGIELSYDTWLMGAPGLKKVVKDCKGSVVQNIAIIKEAKQGKDVKLSIDRRIQYWAFQLLTQVLETFPIESGSMVVIDVPTGEVLAMATAPSCDVNVDLNPKFYRNRMVVDRFEAGSTMKTFSIISGLRSGAFNEKSRIQAGNGYMMVHGKKVRDEHIEPGWYCLSDILAKSSNIGVAKVVLASPAQAFIDTLKMFGFGSATGVGFISENSGFLDDQSAKTDPFTLATMSFGYGISVTAMQLMQAYLTIARGGQYIPVTILKDKNKNYQAKEILKPAVNQAVVRMLSSVFEKGGTGQTIGVEHYRLAGKSGTTRVLRQGHYVSDEHNSNFIGFGPIDGKGQSRFLIGVFLNQVKGPVYYGALTAGPVFSKMMRRLIYMHHIPRTHTS